MTRDAERRGQRNTDSQQALGASPGPRWPGPLAEGFARIPPGGRWWLALSGGFDSVLLLHLARAWLKGLSGNTELCALHINHQLQPEAADWQAFCKALCDRLKLPLVCETVQVPRSGQGLEGAARQARYRAFAERLAPGDSLLLAHHGDDQAETLLLRMLRGAGIAGLAAMPFSRPLGQGRLYRPLLGLSREALRALPEARDLDWCEDPSNAETQPDRNYLRHKVLPRLRERWPAATGRLGTVARHCAEAGELLADLAREDGQAVVCRQGQALELEALAELPERRQRNLVRWWLGEQGVARMPPERRLRQGLEDLVAASPDRQPELAWEGWRLRRYQGRLWLLESGRARLAPATWDGRGPLQWGERRLVTQPVEGEGIRPSCWPLTVKPRAGGERIPAGDGRPGKSLKQWLQEKGLPPWERERLPLFWCESELVAVGTFWIAPAFRAAEGETGYRLCWASMDGTGTID